MGIKNKSIFHLAIPCKDLNESYEFYDKRFGFKMARRYEDRITFNVLGDQLVCHLTNKKDIEISPKLYPRHFGLTFLDKKDFDQYYKLAQLNKNFIFKDLFIRWLGRKDEHHSFFLCDPANNLIEFKYYKDPKLIY